MCFSKINRIFIINTNNAQYTTRKHQSSKIHYRNKKIHKNIPNLKIEKLSIIQNTKYDKNHRAKKQYTNYLI